MNDQHQHVTVRLATRGLAHAAWLLCCVIGTVAWGQPAAPGSYPTKPIKIVVPFPPGGGTDIIGRMIGAKLSENWKQPVVIENRPGASGNIGADYVSRQAPDGYTLMITSAPFAIAPAIFQNLAFDPIKNFTSITQIATVPLIVVTAPDSALKSMNDLIALARKDGEKVNFGSFGNGSPAHLVGESIKQLANIKMTHVPYKGGPAAIPDVVSGQLTFAVLDSIATAPMIRNGQLRALAIMGTKRSPPFPDLPTLSQAGIAFEAVGWHAIFAPANMTKPLADRLNSEINQIAALPDIREKIISGCSIQTDPPL